MFSPNAERSVGSKDLGGPFSLSETTSDPSNVQAAVTLPSGPRYGRPSDRFGPPTVLFNEALALLKYSFDHLDRLEPPPHILGAAFKFATKAASFYETEVIRARVLQDDLKSLLGENVEWEKSIAGETAKLDGVWFEGSFAYMILELKNEPGLGGDPFLQGLTAYGKIISTKVPFPSPIGGPATNLHLQYSDYITRSNFPVILLGIAGNVLTVSTAIYTNAVYANTLLLMELNFGLHASENVLRVARVFSAMSECTRKLTHHYKSLKTVSGIHPGVMYPSPTADPPGTEIPPLEFISKLDRLTGTQLATVNADNELHAIYFAKLPSTEVVLVKFTPRYNELAHRLLANHRPPLAPALYSCSRVIGDLYMVVMEYKSDASPLHRFFPPFGLPYLPKAEVVRAELTNALELLHREDLVFGDLRQMNILYSHQGDRVFLVDFDWVGKDGETHYPACLNPDLGLNVGRWQLMEKGHDHPNLGRVMDRLSEKLMSKS